MKPPFNITSEQELKELYGIKSAFDSVTKELADHYVGQYAQLQHKVTQQILALENGFVSESVLLANLKIRAFVFKETKEAVYHATWKHRTLGEVLVATFTVPRLHLEEGKVNVSFSFKGHILDENFNRIDNATPASAKS